MTLALRTTRHARAAPLMYLEKALMYMKIFFGNSKFFLAFQLCKFKTFSNHGGLMPLPNMILLYVLGYTRVWYFYVLGCTGI